MSARTYWLTVLIVLVFVVAGMVLFDLPRTNVVERRLLGQFYEHEYVFAALIGIVAGSLGGWHAKGSLRHIPRERGKDYNVRVGWRGFWVGVASAILAALVVVVYASRTELDPLAPLERIVLVSRSGLFFVVLAIAFLAGVVTYAVMTRGPAWGGQYALIKRFK